MVDNFIIPMSFGITKNYHSRLIVYTILSNVLIPFSYSFIFISYIRHLHPILCIDQ